jgi:hypothetical protein
MEKTYWVMKTIKYYFLYVLLILQVTAIGQENTNNNNLLPWQREIPLREAAKSVMIESKLNPTDPDRGAMSINNLKMNTTLWGPTNRITISLTKNDVWDRRLHEFKEPTLQEITEGAFSPANKYYVGVKEIQSYLFDKVDFRDFMTFTDKLIKKADPVSIFVNSKLSADLKASMTKYLESGDRSLEQKQVLMTNLAAELNNVVGGELIYTPDRFNGILLRPDTEELLKKKPTGTDLMTLNRYLLEDAYTKEIWRKPGNSLRELDLGWLTKEGGSVDPYRYPMRYAFPCLKPVGQIIVGIDQLTGAEPPKVSQNCANGVTSMQITKGNAKANLEYVLGMTSNIYAVRGNLKGIKSPVFIRLYRHRDTAHMVYMTEDGKNYTIPDAVKDSAFNGPIDPPTSGNDGQFFWIRQKMPAEKTFPKGFEYVLMGVVTSPGKVKVESVEGKDRLGTPPLNSPMPWDFFGIPRPDISKVPGAASTATIKPSGNCELVTLVTIVTTIDGDDLLAVAKKRLQDAMPAGFEGIVNENTKWWSDFYDKRENGRVYYGLNGTACTDNIRNIYNSYTDSHGGGTKTDMRQLECSAEYALPERDIQYFDSAPCYNEIFCTSRFVRNWGDSEDMWKQIVEYWTPGGQENARDMFNMPGMLITHGYLPPIKPDKYVHTTATLELCLGTMAEIVRPAWDEWDYGGDTAFLRHECYPMLKQMALFYAAYAKKSADGFYHVIPSMEEERWGIYPEFSHNKDVISSLCMFRWGLTRAADAAELLGVDLVLRLQWRYIAARIAPYPTWQKPEGLVYAELPGFEPRRDPRDHQNEVNSYLTILADEINLDSPQSEKEMMLRTVRMTPKASSTGEALTLLGVAADPKGRWHGGGGGGGGAGIGGDAETFLNSRSGRIHVFPAVWPSTVVAFHNFQAGGGFLVSAAKDSDSVYYLKIEARRSISCKVMNPWPGKQISVYEEGTKNVLPVKMDNSNGECIVFSAIAGHSYLINPDFKALK